MLSYSIADAAFSYNTVTMSTHNIENQWAMITLTRFSENISIYLNGTLMNSSYDAGSNADVSTTGDMYLGCNRAGSGSWWKGKIDELAIFSGYVLTEQDMSDLLNSGNPSTPEQYPFSYAPASTGLALSIPYPVNGTTYTRS